MVVLVRELGITALRFFVIRHGVIPASRGGKAKTFVQNIAIGLYVLPLYGRGGVGPVLGHGTRVGADGRDRRGLRVEGGTSAPYQREDGVEAAAAAS